MSGELRAGVRDSTAPHKARAQQPRSRDVVCSSGDLLPVVLMEVGVPWLLQTAAVCIMWKSVVASLDDAPPWQRLCESSSPLIAQLKQGCSWRQVYFRWRVLQGKTVPVPPTVRLQDYAMGLEMRSAGRLLFAGMNTLGSSPRTPRSGVSSKYRDLTTVSAVPGKWPLEAWIGEQYEEDGTTFEGAVTLTCFLMRKRDGKLYNVLTEESRCAEFGGRFIWTLRLQNYVDFTINAVAICQLPGGMQVEEDEIYDHLDLRASRRGSSIVGVRVECYTGGTTYDLLTALAQDDEASKWI